MIGRVRAVWQRLPRRLLFVAADLLALGSALAAAYLLRFDGHIPATHGATMPWIFGLAVVAKLPVFAAFRMYRFSWAQVGLRELWDTLLACVCGSAVLTALLFLLRQWPPLLGVPRSVLGMDFALTLIGVSGVRLFKRLVRLTRQRTHGRGGLRTLVAGAGNAGTQLVRAIRDEMATEYYPVGLVDDDPGKHGLVVQGLRVMGSRFDLPALIARHDIGAIIVAMPSAAPAVVRETVHLARRAGVKEIRIVPSLSQLYTGEVRVSEVREVRPEDLLQREPVHIDTARVSRFLDGKKLLVTGAAGSIGSEISRQLLRFPRTQLVVIDHDETGLFRLDQELRQRFAGRRIEVEIADVRDERRVVSIMNACRPDVVYHAAALKHVPLMEAAPAEAVKTNVRGTRIVVDAACRAEATAVVLVSTDKAVNPTSVMGATKRLAEEIVRVWNDRFPTSCLAVRFGNVLGSRGSVVPTFVEQIQRGGPVTVTHPEMRRYFMVTSEAVLLLLQASAMGSGGEVFVLDMGDPVLIAGLARELIRSHGLIPDRDIALVYTGMRPGEKLSEELLTAEEGVDATEHRRVMSARLFAGVEPAVLDHTLAALQEAVSQEDREAVVRLLQMAVPSFDISERPRGEDTG